MKLTVGEIRKSIEKFSDDIPVYIEIIEDIYFQKYGWKSEKASLWGIPWQIKR